MGDHADDAMFAGFDEPWGYSHRDYIHRPRKPTNRELFAHVNTEAAFAPAPLGISSKGQKEETMADTYRFVCAKPARLLYSSITAKSAPRGIANAVAKFSGTFGIEEEDFKAIIAVMIEAIKSETGGFTSPADYYLACQSGATAGKRAMQKAELDAQGKSSDDAFRIREKAAARVKLYEPYAGILTASSQFDVELARLEAGKVVDIAAEEHARAQAGKDFFYPGAYVVPAVALKGFRRKTLDAKDGCTAYLQNVLYVRKGERLAGGSGPANNEVFGAYAGYSDYDPLANAPSNEDLAAGSAGGEAAPADSW